MAESILDTVSNDPQDEFALDPNEAPSLTEKQADNPTDPPEDDALSDSPGSEDIDDNDPTSTKKDWIKRHAGARAQMQEEIEKRARLEGELTAVKNQVASLQARDLQTPTQPEEKPLFAWMENLEEEFEEDPTSAIKGMAKNLSDDMQEMMSRQDRYFHSQLQAADPRRDQVEKVRLELSGNTWFNEISPEAQGGAIAARMAEGGSNGTEPSNGNQPPSPPEGPAGRRPAKVKKEVPMEKDPRFRDFFIRTGALREEGEQETLNSIRPVGE